MTFVAWFTRRVGTGTLEKSRAGTRIFEWASAFSIPPWTLCSEGISVLKKKSFYVVLVSRDEDGAVRRVPVPLHFAWAFAGAAIIGLFTVAGLAGSYSRMLMKTQRFNQLRSEHNALLGDYAKLEKREHEKEVQAASLGALASEVSALYGLTASTIASGTQSGATFLGKSLRKSSGVQSGSQIAAVPVAGTDASFSNASYYKSVSDFYALRSGAMNGGATRAIASSLTRLNLSGFESGFTGTGAIPTLWPVMGSITSSFGAREDPMLGNGEGEFHKGVDIAAPFGTPIVATADGTIESAAMGNGYGNEVVIDHGGGVKTIYAHMSGFHCSAGDYVLRGQVIGYVGMSGRTTGPHVHYEVRMRDVAVNPYKYLRDSPDGIAGPQLASK
jgi:murein DD-endopeptidase MepM/ murein hydrolase activator NlpD